MTRDEYIDMRRSEAWRRAKAALQECWEWDGQRITGRMPNHNVPAPYEIVRKHVNDFIRETEDEGIIE